MFRRRGVSNMSHRVALKYNPKTAVLNYATAVAPLARVHVGVVPGARAPALDEPRPALLEFVDCASAEEAHGAVKLDTEDLEGLDDALVASGGKTVEVGLADADGVGTEGEGLGDVGAALHAAVEDDLRVRPNGLPDRGQDVDGGGRRLELPSSVVRHPHSREPNLLGLDGVVRADDTLDGTGHAPLAEKPLGVLPVECGVDLAVDEGSEGVGGDLGVDAGIVVCGIGKEVPGPGGGLDRLPNLRGGVVGGDGEAVADVALPVSVPREVDGERHSVETPFLSLLEDVLYELPVLPHIQLEDLGALVDLADLRDARGREGGEAVEGSVVFGGLGGGGLAPGMEHAVACGRASEEGELHVLPKHLRAQVQRRLQAREDVVVHLELGVGVLASAQGDLVVGAGVEVVEDHTVGAELCDLAEVGDVHGLPEHPLVRRVQDAPNEGDLSKDLVHSHPVKRHD
mmetsp:Transcript_14838/g.30293  ORF Transcript_14838/g.30293 Transcript_14838/m.30293 type:complete len:457 (+) Transcript_14838:104-1474(+)